MNFLTFGPFPVPLHIEQKSDALGKLFNNAKTGLNDASGVYIFVRRSAEELRPVYVGRTIDNSFGGRLASHFNKPKNTLLHELWESAPSDVEILLIASIDSNGSFFNFETDAYKFEGAVKWLEDVMIGSCYEINHDLYNIKDMSFYRQIHVPGYVNDTSEDRENPAACALAKMLRKECKER